MTILSALLVGMAALWWRPGRARAGRTATTGTSVGPPSAGSRGGQSWVGRHSRLVAPLVAAVAVWVLLGGVVGLVLGGLIAGILPTVLARMESAASRRRRQSLTKEAPLVADLMAGCLSAGSSLSAAAAAAGEAVGGDIGELLAECVAQFGLGADQQRVWEPLARFEATAPIARAIHRSDASGAPLTDVLLRVADELRAQHRATLERDARAVGVKAVGPLGICFLPAFVLLGVVPLVASLVTEGLFG